MPTEEASPESDAQTFANDLPALFPGRGAVTIKCARWCATKLLSPRQRKLSSAAPSASLSGIGAGIKRIKTGTSSTMKHDVDEEAPSSSSIESSHSRRKRFTKADAHHAASLRRTKERKMLRGEDLAAPLLIESHIGTPWRLVERLTLLSVIFSCRAAISL